MLFRRLSKLAIAVTGEKLDVLLLVVEEMGRFSELCEVEPAALEPPPANEGENALEPGIFPSGARLKGNCDLSPSDICLLRKGGRVEDMSFGAMPG